MDLEKIVYENSISIARNTANIGHLMKLFYIVGGGILAQVGFSLRNMIGKKK